MLDVPVSAASSKNCVTIGTVPTEAEQHGRPPSRKRNPNYPEQSPTLALPALRIGKPGDISPVGCDSISTRSRSGNGPAASPGGRAASDASASKVRSVRTLPSSTAAAPAAQSASRASCTAEGCGKLKGKQPGFASLVLSAGPRATTTSKVPTALRVGTSPATSSSGARGPPEREDGGAEGTSEGADDAKLADHEVAASVEKTASLAKTATLGKVVTYGETLTVAVACAAGTHDAVAADGKSGGASAANMKAAPRGTKRETRTAFGRLTQNMRISTTRNLRATAQLLPTDINVHEAEKAKRRQSWLARTRARMKAKLERTVKAKTAAVERKEPKPKPDVAAPAAEKDTSEAHRQEEGNDTRAGKDAQKVDVAANQQKEDSLSKMLHSSAVAPADIQKILLLISRFLFGDEVQGAVRAGGEDEERDVTAAAASATAASAAAAAATDSREEHDHIAVCSSSKASVLKRYYLSNTLAQAYGGRLYKMIARGGLEHFRSHGLEGEFHVWGARLAKRVGEEVVEMKPGNSSGSKERKVERKQALALELAAEYEKQPRPRKRLIEQALRQFEQKYTSSTARPAAPPRAQPPIPALAAGGPAKAKDHNIPSSGAAAHRELRSVYGGPTLLTSNSPKVGVTWSRTRAGPGGQKPQVAPPLKADGQHPRTFTDPEPSAAAADASAKHEKCVRDTHEAGFGEGDEGGTSAGGTLVPLALAKTRAEQEEAEQEDVINAKTTNNTVLSATVQKTVPVQKTVTLAIEEDCKPSLGKENQGGSTEQGAVPGRQEVVDHRETNMDYTGPLIECRQLLAQSYLAGLRSPSPGGCSAFSSDADSAGFSPRSDAGACRLRKKNVRAPGKSWMKTKKSIASLARCSSAPMLLLFAGGGYGKVKAKEGSTKSVESPKIATKKRTSQSAKSLRADLLSPSTSFAHDRNPSAITRRKSNVQLRQARALLTDYQQFSAEQLSTGYPSADVILRGPTQLLASAWRANAFASALRQRTFVKLVQKRERRRLLKLRRLRQKIMTWKKKELQQKLEKQRNREIALASRKAKTIKIPFRAKQSVRQRMKVVTCLRKAMWGRDKGEDDVDAQKSITAAKSSGGQQENAGGAVSNRRTGALGGGFPETTNPGAAAGPAGAAPSSKQHRDPAPAAAGTGLEIAAPPPGPAGAMPAAMGAQKLLLAAQQLVQQEQGVALAPGSGGPPPRFSRSNVLHVNARPQPGGGPSGRPSLVAKPPAEMLTAPRGPRHTTHRGSRAHSARPSFVGLRAGVSSARNSVVAPPSARASIAANDPSMKGGLGGGAPTSATPVSKAASLLERTASGTSFSVDKTESIGSVMNFLEQEWKTLLQEVFIRYSFRDWRDPRVVKSILRDVGVFPVRVRRPARPPPREALRELHTAIMSYFYGNSVREQSNLQKAPGFLDRDETPESRVGRSLSSRVAGGRVGTFAAAAAVTASADLSTLLGFAPLSPMSSAYHAMGEDHLHHLKAVTSASEDHLEDSTSQPPPRSPSLPTRATSRSFTPSATGSANLLSAANTTTTNTSRNARRPSFRGSRRSTNVSIFVSLGIVNLAPSKKPDFDTFARVMQEIRELVLTFQKGVLGEYLLECMLESENYREASARMGTTVGSGSDVCLYMAEAVQQGAAESGGRAGEHGSGAQQRYYATAREDADPAHATSSWETGRGNRYQIAAHLAQLFGCKLSTISRDLAHYLDNFRAGGGTGLGEDALLLQTGSGTGGFCLLSGGDVVGVAGGGRAPSSPRTGKPVVAVAQSLSTALERGRQEEAPKLENFWHSLRRSASPRGGGTVRVTGINAVGAPGGAAASSSAPAGAPAGGATSLPATSSSFGNKLQLHSGTTGAPAQHAPHSAAPDGAVDTGVGGGFYKSRVDCMCKLLPRVFQAAGLEPSFDLADVINDFFDAYYFRHPTSVFSTVAVEPSTGAEHKEQSGGEQVGGWSQSSTVAPAASSTVASSGTSGRGGLSSSVSKAGTAGGQHGTAATSKKGDQATSSSSCARSRIRKSVTHGNLDHATQPKRRGSIDKRRGSLDSAAQQAAGHLQGGENENDPSAAGAAPAVAGHSSSQHGGADYSGDLPAGQPRERPIDLDDLVSEGDRLQQVIRQLIEQSWVVRRAKEREVVKFFSLEELVANDDTAFYEVELNGGAGPMIASSAAANGHEENDGVAGVTVSSVGSLTLGKARSGTKASMIAEEESSSSLPPVAPRSFDRNLTATTTPSMTATSPKSWLNTPTNAGPATVVSTPGGTVLSPLSSPGGGNSFRSFCRNSLIAHSHSVKQVANDDQVLVDAQRRRSGISTSTASQNKRVRNTTIGFANSVSSSSTSTSNRGQGSAEAGELRFDNDDDAGEQPPRPSSSMDSIQRVLSGVAGPGGRNLNKGLSIILDSPETDGAKDGFSENGSNGTSSRANRISREVREDDEEDEDTFSLAGNDRAVSASLKTVARFKRLNSGHRLSEAPVPPPKRITLKLKNDINEKAAKHALQETVGHTPSLPSSANFAPMQGARVSICIPQDYGGAGRQDGLGGFDDDGDNTAAAASYQTSKRSSVLTRDQSMMRRPSILKKSGEPPRRVSHALLNGGGGADRHHSIEEQSKSGHFPDSGGKEQMRPLVESCIVSVEELLPWLELFHRHAEPIDDKKNSDAAARELENTIFAQNNDLAAVRKARLEFRHSPTTSAPRGSVFMQNSLENGNMAPPSPAAASSSRRSQHPAAFASNVPTPAGVGPVIPGAARRTSLAAAVEKREAEAEALSKVQIMAASLPELRNLLRKRLKKYAVRIPTLSTLLVAWGILPNAMHETRALEELARSASLTGTAAHNSANATQELQKNTSADKEQGRAGFAVCKTATAKTSGAWANAMFSFSDVVQLISLIRRWKRAQREEVIAGILPPNWEYLTFRGVLYVLQKAHLEPKSQAEQLAMTRILDEEWPTEGAIPIRDAVNLCHRIAERLEAVRAGNDWGYMTRLVGLHLQHQQNCYARTPAPETSQNMLRKLLVAKSAFFQQLAQSSKRCENHECLRPTDVEAATKLALSSPGVAVGGYGYGNGGGSLRGGLGAGNTSGSLHFANGGSPDGGAPVNVNGGTRAGMARGAEPEPDREMSLYRFLRIFAGTVFPQ